MTATIAPNEWLAFVEREYLDAFIRDGGSSIKFAVALDDAARSAVSDGIARTAESAGYVVARVSSEDTKIHLIDQLFFRVTEQIQWQKLTQRVVYRLGRLISLVPAPERSDDGEFIERFAGANQTEPDWIRLKIDPIVRDKVFKNRKLARDFRVAASHLCLAELAGGAHGAKTTVDITDWLTGRNKAVANVRQYQIFTRIHRTNARHLFASLLRWVRLADMSGVVIIVDMTRVTVPVNPRDGTVFYTKAAMFDAYEVLRQFIDATDELKGLLLVLLPGSEFLDLESTGRGLGAYDALKFRVFDEIRDQRLVNPMSALVRITGTGGRA